MNGTNRILTVPNAISLARLISAPVFVWLLFGPGAYGWAAGVLAFAAISDWADGKLARALHQETELGADLDLMADGIMVAVVLVALTLKAIMPWWLFGALALRELVLVIARRSLRREPEIATGIMWLDLAGIIVMIIALPLLLLGWSTLGLGMALGGVILLYISAAGQLRAT